MEFRPLRFQKSQAWKLSVPVRIFSCSKKFVKIERMRWKNQPKRIAGRLYVKRENAYLFEWDL
jgi:hypothetical protein